MATQPKPIRKTKNGGSKVIYFRVDDSTLSRLEHEADGRGWTVQAVLRELLAARYAVPFVHPRRGGPKGPRSAKP